jgi:acetyl-CoA C-acetyltransferase
MHYQPTRRVAIVGSKRIPFLRANTNYAESSNQEMMTAALAGLVSDHKLQGERLGDVSLGSVLKHSRDWNLARECVLGTELSPETPAFDLQRACGTSLEAAILIGNKIALSQIDAGIAGGVDTISDAPIVLNEELRKLLLRSARGRSMGDRLKPWLGFRPRHFKPGFPGVTEPRTGLSMGESTADRDNNIRADTSVEKLAKLRTVFDRTDNGTMTAGNSTPLTDGAASVLLASEDWARERGLPVLAYLAFGQVAAVDFIRRDGLLMAPAFAVSNMLKAANLGFADFDLFEIHEAFAAQTLATLKAWEDAEFCRERLEREAPLGPIDRAKLNTKGGSIAIGHPFAATGARILGGLAKMLDQRGGGRGLISVCTAGGMGVTAIVEK